MAALIEDEVALKCFYRTKKQIRLESANPKYPALIFKKGEPGPLRILVVMAGLVRKR